jgi:protein gp37
MAENSKIAWTTHTANFWMGCDKISPGCAHCYADTLTTNRMGLNLWGKDSARQAVKNVWANVRKWEREAKQRGERVRMFVMSLGDFFEDHPQANVVRDAVWPVLRDLEHIDLQILTKRPENFAKFLPFDMGWPWPHAWLGVSVENQRFANSRIPILLNTPAMVRFISAEPLLGPVDLREAYAAGPGSVLDWVIVGGESGPGYRPMDHAWARALRDQCVDDGTAFFMKQSAAPRTEMGTYLIEADGSRWAWKQYPRTPFKPSGVYSAPLLVSE